MEYFLSVIGMVMFVEGLPYFAAPDKIKIWISKLVEMESPALRKLGFGLMAAGLFLVYLSKR
jgi:uncharacterized protein